MSEALYFVYIEIDGVRYTTTTWSEETAIKLHKTLTKKFFPND